MWQWYNQTNRAIRVQKQGSDSAVPPRFGISPEGKLMPLPTEQPAVAYPRHTVTDDRPTGEQSLSARFFERNPAHLIGRRTGSGVWPADSLDAEARRDFDTGQTALYETKDVTAAINAYESATIRDAAYIKAWVALSIAYITDNTPESLQKADEVLTFLAELAPGDWLSREASGIIHQNRAYLSVHRFRQTGETDTTLLARADADYAVCDARTDKERERLEYLCPWTYVKLVRGDHAAAESLWNRARNRAATLGAGAVLSEYAAKYAPLRDLTNGAISKIEL